MSNRFKGNSLNYLVLAPLPLFEGNQLRLWKSSVAYVLMNALRAQCLANTELQHAQVGTIRTTTSLGLSSEQCSTSSDFYQRWLSVSRYICCAQAFTDSSQSWLNPPLKSDVAQKYNYLSLLLVQLILSQVIFHEQILLTR